jgi:hypothetical protein
MNEELFFLKGCLCESLQERRYGSLKSLCWYVCGIVSHRKIRHEQEAVRVVGQGRLLLDVRSIL